MPVASQGLFEEEAGVRKAALRVRALSTMIGLTLCLSAILALLGIPSLDGASPAIRYGPGSSDTTAVEALALMTSHDPISIEGNAGFTNASGVVWGSGAESDPYIIEGWDINASIATGIRIQNADEYFTIRNCYFHNGRDVGNNRGISLMNCTNGTIIDNVFSNNSWDIELHTSMGVVLVNNTCSSGYASIGLYRSDNNVLENNICSSIGTGIRLESSSDNELRDNICESSDGGGIFLSGSDGNLLNNNICNSNNWSGIMLSVSNYNTLNDNTCDSNNWSGIELDSYSDGNTLTNNTFGENSRAGIDIVRSSNNMLVENACPNNRYGILIDVESDGNEVTRNVVSGCIDYSVYVISAASGNRIWNNTFIGSSSYDPNNIQALDAGTNNWWNSTDGWGNYWSDWYSPDIDMNGIVDHPYVLVSLTGVARDYYPLTAPVFTKEPVTQMNMSGKQGTNQWYVGPVRLVFLAYETVSGVNWTKYSVDGGLWLLCTNPVTVTSEGEHEIEYYSQDYSGQTEAVQTRTLKIDATPPTTEANLSGNESVNQWYVSSVNIELDSYDSISGVNLTMYQIDDGSLEVYSNPFNWSSDDIHTLKFYSQDNAGNVGQVCNLTFKIDMSAPLLVIGIKNNAKFTSSSVLVPWSSTDAGSGVYRTEWSLDHGSWQPCTTDSISLTELTDGSHIMEFRATDYVGHNVTKSISFTVNTNVFSVSGPMGPWLDIGLILLAFVAAVTLVIVFRRKRQRPEQLESEFAKKD